MKTLLCAFAFALALLGSASESDACVLDSITPITFGDYDVYSNADLEGLGGIRYYCVISLSIRVDISTGGGTYAQRKMARMGGGDSLNYQIYTDAARTKVWGNGTGGTFRYGPIVGLLNVTTIPVYGSITKKQNVQTGTYTDTVVVTLNF